MNENYTIMKLYFQQAFSSFIIVGHVLLEIIVFNQYSYFIIIYK